MYFFLTVYCLLLKRFVTLVCERRCTNKAYLLTHLDKMGFESCGPKGLKNSYSLPTVLMSWLDCMPYFQHCSRLLTGHRETPLTFSTGDAIYELGVPCNQCLLGFDKESVWDDVGRARSGNSPVCAFSLAHLHFATLLTKFPLLCKRHLSWTWPQTLVIAS